MSCQHMQAHRTKYFTRSLTVPIDAVPVVNAKDRGGGVMNSQKGVILHPVHRLYILQRTRDISMHGFLYSTLSLLTSWQGATATTNSSGVGSRSFKSRPALTANIIFFDAVLFDVPTTTMSPPKGSGAGAVNGNISSLSSTTQTGQRRNLKGAFPLTYRWSAILWTSWRSGCSRACSSDRIGGNPMNRGYMKDERVRTRSRKRNLALTTYP